MKAEIKEIQEEKKFKPFKVELTVESIEETRLLYHVFNRLNLNTVLQDAGPELRIKGCAKDFSGNRIYQIFEKEIKRQGFEI